MKYREIADGIFVDRPNRFIVHMGNKAVGTVNKNAVCDFSVFQCLLHFCLIHLRRPCIKAAEDDPHIVVGVVLQPISHCIHRNWGGGIQRIAIHARRNCRERNAMDIMLFGKVQRIAVAVRQLRGILCCAGINRPTV